MLLMETITILQILHQTALVPAPMRSARSSLSQGSRLPTLDGGESTRGLASFCTKILLVPVPARSIDGLPVGTMHHPSKPLVGLPFGRSQYGSNRASRTFTLPKLGHCVSDNIELLPANMCSLSRIRLLLMDDLATPTFNCWFIKSELSSRSLLSKGTSAGITLD